MGSNSLSSYIEHLKIAINNILLSAQRKGMGGEKVNRFAYCVLGKHTKWNSSNFMWQTGGGALHPIFHRGRSKDPSYSRDSKADYDLILCILTNRTKFIQFHFEHSRLHTVMIWKATRKM